ncbi:hypothetical protein MKZ38_005524 [Zalerion maritima]|uniref:S-adenosyl-L-methionine-dependent tRNA 4-demethylwyosine synthase n=1 Tax=Zalerion maritima TaxID=339359 RepID=A0AAD5RXE1_9PEZI|nr:hypothetical protein MKZ38_005524 [Zalerion maritima]
MGIITGVIGHWGWEVEDYLLDVWEAHRTPIILATSSILICVWLYLYFSEEREGLVALPRQYTVETKRTSPFQLSNPLPTTKPKVVGEKATTVGPKRIRGEIPRQTTQKESPKRDGLEIQVLVFYSSLTGKTEKAVKDLVEVSQEEINGAGTGTCRFPDAQILDLSEIDYDEYFINPPKREDGKAVDYFYLLLLPSYNIDTINDTFLEHLKETHNDFRIDSAPLSNLVGYSVFGFGDREGWPTEEDGYGFQAKEVDRWMAKLTGRKRAFPLGLGDLKMDGKARLLEWSSGLIDVLRMFAQTGVLGDGVRGSGDADESDGEYASDEEEDTETSIEGNEKPTKNKGSIDDVEDLGKMVAPSEKAPLAIDFTTYGKSKPVNIQTPQAKEMVPKTSPTYAALTKQGYSIIGSHSGVKICRWTKSALRGRGSCYKYSFYGINSHQCMESTPSLSCSNKCVFCWRHGTNPVGTIWRWQVDPPDLIFSGIKEAHYKKIKMMRGVPGVRAERFQEAMRIRHCALSLVGEPIFYPHINEFVGMLHAERISTFLVCNAQHPDQLAALKPITQLYVSIDAADKESLRRIDRPLHRDFWERFQRCLEILREKRFKQRTVFRLTLVKGFNIDEAVKGYADLVDKALPCFVEIKGVTYCGTSTSSSAGLTMANVPFYAEIQEFVEALNHELNSRGLEYGIAAEHAHSCCALLASARFKKNGKWHTRIDYDRFFDLWEERGPDGDWTPEDYMGEETPEWATWGNGGFDPRDTRVDRKGRKIEV